jgi:hypothetical protein
MLWIDGRKSWPISTAASVSSTHSEQKLHTISKADFYEERPSVTNGLATAYEGP